MRSPIHCCYCCVPATLCLYLHYTVLQFVESTVFDEALESISGLIDDYTRLGTAEPPIAQQQRSSSSSSTQQQRQWSMPAF
jgi:hypothetical protein